MQRLGLLLKSRHKIIHHIEKNKPSLIMLGPLER
jgi:hypothetical protein